MHDGADSILSFQFHFHDQRSVVPSASYGPQALDETTRRPLIEVRTGTCTSTLLYNDFMSVCQRAWLYSAADFPRMYLIRHVQSTMKYDYAKKAEVAAARHRQKYLQALAEARSSFVDKNKQAARRGHVRPRSVIALRPGC